MTQSIRKNLVMLPNGKYESELDKPAVAAYLKNVYIDRESEKVRRTKAKLLTDLYEHKGDDAMSRMIDAVFKDAQVKEERKKWIAYSRSNPTKRITDEISVVYQEPAMRSVSGVQDNERYQKIIAQSRQDEVFRKMNQMANLHKALFVRPRVTVIDEDTREASIDLALPSNVCAIRHPNDPTKSIGVIVTTGYYGQVNLENGYPAYEVWTDHEKFSLNSQARLIENTWVEHGLGVNPWIYFSIEPPIGDLWFDGAGNDMLSGHMAIWFLNVQMMKESKSKNRQAALQGDMTTAARSQVADSEVPIELSDGTTISNIETGVDTEEYRDNANHFLEYLANNYGISAGILKHQGVQSADARELMRAPIQEIRKSQVKVFHEFERKFVEVQAKVIARDMPNMAFSTEGWTIHFGTTLTALSEKEELDVFEKRRTLGVTNTALYLMKKHGISEQQAMDLIQKNVEVELKRNVLMRPLQRVNGSMGQENHLADAPVDNAEPTIEETNDPSQ